MPPKKTDIHILNEMFFFIGFVIDFDFAVKRETQVHNLSSNVKLFRKNTPYT